MIVRVVLLVSRASRAARSGPTSPIQWRYVSATLDGEPVPSRAEIGITFERKKAWRPSQLEHAPRRPSR